jgi:CheY-like chemotaxis protein
MFENLPYPAIGFVVTLLGLEAAWYFTVCKLADKAIKPLYVQTSGVSSNEDMAGKM